MPKNWPEDHPGRRCGLCNNAVYTLWVDDTPPPGTCIESCSKATDCRQAIETALSGWAMAVFSDRKVTDELCERLAKVGLTPVTAALEIQRRESIDGMWFDLIASQWAPIMPPPPRWWHRLAFWRKPSPPHEYKVADFHGQALADWVWDDPRVNLPALLRWIVWQASNRFADSDPETAERLLLDVVDRGKTELAGLIEMLNHDGSPAEDFAEVE